ncbi:ABC transporter permease [Mameliella sp.]|uniref:ABC transporter permease n=1 Tax=Mameliella sp. TaxID=1924940 RepID=UPI003BA9FDD4
MPRTRRAVAQDVIAPVAGCLAIGALWGLAAHLTENPVLLPPPGAVLSALVDILQDELVGDILASLYHLVTGMAAGVTLGLVMAFAAAANQWFSDLVEPLVELLRPISGIAWIPLAIMMFGIGEAVPIFLIGYVSVFPIFLNTLAGIRSVDARLVQAARVLGASSMMVQRDVILPAALPMILSGLRLSLGVAWMTLIGAELIGGESGLGWRAFWYEQFFAMNKNLAVILVVGLLGLTFDTAIRMLKKRLVRWQPSGEGPT